MWDKKNFMLANMEWRPKTGIYVFFRRHAIFTGETIWFLAETKRLASIEGHLSFVYGTMRLSKISEKNR